MAYTSHNAKPNKPTRNKMGKKMGKTPTNTQTKNKTPEQLEYLKTHLYMQQKTKKRGSAIKNLFTKHTETPDKHPLTK